MHFHHTTTSARLTGKQKSHLTAVIAWNSQIVQRLIDMKRLICLSLLLSLSVLADQMFPTPEWEDSTDPLASPDAVPGGEMSVFAGQSPQSFNYYLDNNVFSMQVFSMMYETLLETHPISAAFEPGLAARWSISDDKKTFTFWLDDRARWSDGKPVTADDVLWTFEAIMNPKNLTGVHKVSLETFEPPRKMDARTVRFRAREVHWRNLLAVGRIQILPKHVFEKLDFNKINFEFPVVSGPYRLGDIKESIYAKIERRADWWARTHKRNQNILNFGTITFRFFAERENAYEAFKKGQMDIYPIYTSRLWVNETGGAKFARNWIIKQKISNHSPLGFQGFAMNIRRPPFDDLRVRLALAHLLDRERMNRTLMYSQYFMQKSYFEDLYTPDNPCPNAYQEFNKKKARTLLSEAGWKANPKTGLLEKNGEPFEIKFLTRSPSSDKFLAIYSEDLKDVGISMTIDRKDWAAWSKDMDVFNYDMTWAAWGASIFKDPEGMWASREAERKAGNNITGFSSAVADKLIEQQKTIFDIQKRHTLCRQIDSLVAAQCPYALLWNIDYTRLLYWNKFGTPPTVLSKYGDERSLYGLWWADEDSAADLEEAVSQGLPLPAAENIVDFDDAFGK